MPGTRPVALLRAGWQGGSEKTRESIETQQATFLRAHGRRRGMRPTRAPSSSSYQTRTRRRGSTGSRKRLLRGLWRSSSASKREDAGAGAFCRRGDGTARWTRLDKEERGPDDAHGDSGAA